MWTRRAFLHATITTAGILATGSGCGDTDDSPQDGRDFFPQSVASGDPRPTSVVLWTRLEGDPADEVEVRLQVASDANFEHLVSLDGESYLSLQAKAAHDYCVKVRVEGLEPATTYHYRFLYARDGTTYASPTGATKTAPSEDSTEPVRFAFVSCQDYQGRYYNVLAFLAEQDVDFVVHLGDYIYETTGDPSFQSEGGDRSFTFDDEDGALVLGEGDETYAAARSLDNYRQLYRVARTDRALQRVHERFPMIATWDDHEFADDCHGATATHLSGREDETDEIRRKNASQAWFEYMPADVGDYDHSVDFPDDSKIWRDLRFGRHMHLMLTDLRTRRVDHLVAEDAYPGTVVLTEEQLVAQGGSPEAAFPYVTDIETFQDGMYLEPLREAAAAEAYDTDRIRGPISVAWIHRVLAELASPLTPIDEVTQAELPRGYAVLDLGKTDLYSRIGSRYLLDKVVFDLYSSQRFTETDGESEQVMGSEQEEWFLTTIEESSSTWKIWANEFCLIPLQIDLSALPIDPSFRKAFYISTDGWDGSRNRRDRILQVLGGLDNVVAITGDVHAFFAGTPWVNANPDRSIVELVTSSVSSQTYQAVLENQVNTTQLKDVPGATDLAAAIGELLTLPGGPNPHLGFASANRHGLVVVDLDGDRLEATYFMAEADIVDAERYDDDVSDRMRTMRFRVDAGDKTLQREFDGEWRRWDPGSYTWV